MSSSVLEQFRNAQEEIEIIDKAISKVLFDKENPRLRVSADRCVEYLLKLSQEKARQALDIIEDKDGMRQDEINYFAGQKMVGQTNPTDVWINFYDKMKAIKEHHRKTYLKSGATVELRDVNWFYEQSLAHDDTDVIFSGEEKGGKRVDCHHVFQNFLNLKKLSAIRRKNFRNATVVRLKKKNPDISPDDPRVEEELQNFQEIDYITWLGEFEQFHKFPRHVKYRDTAYRAYLDSVLSYVKSFVSRALPLVDQEKMVRQLEEEFGAAWESWSVIGWTEPTHKDPLFCRPSNRVFAAEAAMKGHMNGSQYKKNLAALQAMPMDEQKALTLKFEAEDRSIAFTESLIQKYREVLGDHIAETITHIQKKQSRTAEEIAAGDDSDEELEDDIIPEEVEDSDDEKVEEDRPIYNPLNLPLGWDGKPIPFWLYKLHGLGKEFKCQICGNHSYWGRRAFERHFQEWRHAFGMKCLKIPNTSHFKEITKIEEAVELYDTLKKNAEDQTFRADHDIECEDAHGNVMSIKAFEDLQRQGLI